MKLKDKRGIGFIAIIAIIIGAIFLLLLLGIFAGMVVLMFRVLFSPITAIIAVILIFLLILKKLDLGNDAVKWLVIAIIILAAIYVLLKVGGIDIASVVQQRMG